MGKMIEKAVWLSFDLGVGGDYPGLYKWLDDRDALECGDSIAFFKYKVDINDENNIVQMIEQELDKAVHIRPGDRMYIIHREKTYSGSTVKGDFIFGRRKASPWIGYGDTKSSGSESGE